MAPASINGFTLGPGLILANAPGATRLQKRVVRLWIETTFDDSIQGAIKIFRQSFESPEPHEGPKAFWKSASQAMDRK